MKNLFNSACCVLAIVLSVLTHWCAQAEPLHILLTNDDGIEAPGLKAVETALGEAGYRLSVVAPRTQQSATSMKVTTKKLSFEQLAETRWAVDGTPADAVAVALDLFLAEDSPDFIVSGANFGQNLGSNTNLSGTVGAALMGMQMGVPGIAVSVGMFMDESALKPTRFPSTMTSFKPAAEFTVRLLRAIEKTRSDAAAPLLPANIILNVNYPALSSDKVKGPRLATVARRGGFVAKYVPQENNTELKITLLHEKRLDTGVANADIELFSDGYITISVLNGYLGASRDADTAIENRLFEFLK
ncbi:MAG: 5'/3'-nucleotidase SurE [Pseudomonadota bacterium]